MRRIPQRLAAGLVALLLVVGGVARTDAICPSRLGGEAADPCPCSRAGPAADGSAFAMPCCCAEMGQAPASSGPVASIDVDRVQGPRVPVLLVVEGPRWAAAEVGPRQVPPGDTAGTGPPILRQTSILLI